MTKLTGGIRFKVVEHRIQRRGVFKREGGWVEQSVLPIHQLNNQLGHCIDVIQTFPSGRDNAILEMVDDKVCRVDGDMN